MIVPIFTLDQTEEYILIKVRAPHADFQNLNVDLEERIFYFSSGSYFLKIELTGDVKPGQDNITMKIDGEELTFQLVKQVLGDRFPDLDMLSKLLLSGKKADKGSKIEDLSEPTYEINDLLFNWNQEIPKPPELLVSKGYPFGFASSKKIDSLKNLHEDFILALDITQPETLTTQEKLELKEENESEKFSHDHYISDFFLEGDENVHIVDTLTRQINFDFKPEFTKDEIHRMTVLSTLRLPLIDDEKRITIYLTLLDLLFAYSYDKRINGDDENTESGWNVVKLAASLSWMLEFYDIKEVVRSFLRRSICFPMMRNWQLSQLVIQDVKHLLKSPHNKSWILKYLLDCRSLLINYPGYFIFSSLFLDEYIVWVQNCASNVVLSSMLEALDKVVIKKGDFEKDFNIVKLERLAKKILEEEKLEAEKKNAQMTKEFDRLTITQ